MMAGKVAKVPKYGKLYNYYIIEGIGDYSIIPLAMANAGWTVPLGGVAGYNINTLINYNGGSTADAGAKLKEAGEVYWNGNVGALNTYNFNARGSGYRQSGTGTFTSINTVFAIWEYYAPQTYYFQLTAGGVTGGYADATGAKAIGMALRLVRPATMDEQMYIVDGNPALPYTGNDGLVYPTVKIGTQAWLAYTLAETKLRNGTDIPNVTNNATWAGLTTGAMCDYDNDPNNTFI